MRGRGHPVQNDCNKRIAPSHWQEIFNSPDLRVDSPIPEANPLADPGDGIEFVASVDRLVVLHGGKLIAQGDPQTVIKSTQVAEIYMGIEADA